MNITIETIKENEDGSADCQIHVDKEATEFLIRKAIIDCLKEAIAIGVTLTPPEETK
jgi:hypothetical protein